MSYRKAVLLSSVLITALIASFLPFSGGAVAVPSRGSPPTGCTSALNDIQWYAGGSPDLGELVTLIVEAEVGIGRGPGYDNRYEILSTPLFAWHALEGGETWEFQAYTTSIAFGDVDGDGIDEVGITRHHREHEQWQCQILDDEEENFRLMHDESGTLYNDYATCIAFGDVDGDGLDEVGIAYCARWGVKYRIRDDKHESFITLHTGGSDWDEFDYATCIAFGDVDGDGLDEVGIARKADDEQRYEILDDANHGFSPLYGANSGEAGWSWDNNFFTTCIAFGDVDGDGLDEVGITRYASSGMRFRILDDAIADDPFSTLHDETFQGYATWIAFGDVDLDGYDEVGITRYADSVTWKCRVCDDAANNFAELKSWGGSAPGYSGWGYNTFATCIAFGDIDSDGYDEVGITRYRQANSQACYWILDDANNNFSQLCEGGRDEDNFATFIAFGDVNGDSLVVGEPRHSVQTVVDEIVAVINTPPKHNGVNNEPFKYTATYKNSVEDKVTESVTSKSGWALTVGFKGTYGQKDVYGISLESSIKIDRKHERETTKTYTEDFTRAVTANYDDACILATTEYHVYEYKVLSPADKAVVDGEQQYFLLTVPTGPPSLKYMDLPWWYPRCHTLGDIRTYPYDESQFIRYDDDHVIFDSYKAKTWTDVYDGGVYGTTSCCMKQDTSVKEKDTMATKTSVKASASIGAPATGSVTFSVQHEYEEAQIDTHETKLTEQTCISTYVAGGLTDHWQYYEVKPVFYCDNEFGYPVIDYVITDMGKYYCDLAIHSAILSLDPDVLLEPWYQRTIQSRITTIVVIPDWVWVSSCSTTQIPIQIPIRIENAEDIRSMDITLPYDPDILSPTEVSKAALTAESSLEWDVGDDIIQIALEDSAGINGDGSIVTIEFDVVGSLGDYYTLAPTVSANDGTGQEDESIAVRSGLFLVKSVEEIRGDCDGDGDIDSVDALLALKMSAEPSVNLVADMNDDGQITSSDAAEMLSMGAGKAVLDFYWPLQGIDTGIKPGFEEFEA